jgi:hypothetical protein
MSVRIKLACTFLGAIIFVTAVVNSAAAGTYEEAMAAYERADYATGPGGPRVTCNGCGIGPPFRPMLRVTVGRADLTAGARGPTPSQTISAGVASGPPIPDRCQA